MAILSALWGASYLFIKVALDDGVPPIFIVFSRTVLAAVVLVALAMRAGVLRVSGRWGELSFLAIVQIVAPFLLITYGERHIASGLAGILVASTPICTVLLAIRFDQEERARGIAAAGILVGIVGVILLFGVDLSGDSETIAGGLMVLLASLGYAIGGLFLKARMRGAPVLGLAAWTSIISAVMLAPAALIGGVPSKVPSLEASASLIALGAGGTGIAFAIYFGLISTVGPKRAALVTYIAPAFAVIYGVWLLDEPLTAGAIAGLVLILAGSWLAAEGRLPWRGREVAIPPPEPVPVSE